MTNEYVANSIDVIDDKTYLNCLNVLKIFTQFVGCFALAAGWYFVFKKHEVVSSSGMSIILVSGLLLLIKSAQLEKTMFHENKRLINENKQLLTNLESSNETPVTEIETEPISDEELLSILDENIQKLNVEIDDEIPEWASQPIGFPRRID